MQQRWIGFPSYVCVVVGVLTACASCSDGLTGYGEPLGPAYDGREFPGLSVVYLRLAWSHVEPAEGQFNWSILDTPIQRYGAAGKRFALCLTVFEGDPEQGTPEWVRAAGAQGQIVAASGTSSWEPDYDYPIFLDKLAGFLTAVGSCYDGHPRLAFVDVGTLGIWGEGHPLAKRYLQAVEDYHASYTSIHANPRTFLAENEGLVRRMNLRLGYRVNLTEVSWPPLVQRADGLTVRATWRNAGVAPCLPGGHPTWTLWNERGDRCAALCDEGFDVRTLPPATPGSDAVETRERRFPLPPLLAPGQYTLFVSVGDVAGATCLALPLDGDNGRHGYPVGQVRVE